MTEDNISLLNKVSETVLSTIKKLHGNQTNKAIGLDSLALMLRVNIRELVPVIEHLQKEGYLIIHRNPAGQSKSNKPDSVSLTNNF